MHRGLLVAAVGLAAMLQASSAAASTVTAYAITGGVGEQNQIVLSVTASTVVITDTAGITLDNAPQCTADTANQVSCGNWLPDRLILGDMNDRLTFEPIALDSGCCPGLSALGGSGNDRMDFTGLAATALDDIDSNAAAYTVEANGGDGDDTLIGSQGGNEFDFKPLEPPNLNFDAGDDTLIGGPGADLLGAGEGADFADGRDGPDDIIGALEAGFRDDGALDTLLCGPGGIDPVTTFPDLARAGVGDAVGTDCEALLQLVVCPPTGAICVGTPQVTTVTTTTTAASGSAAATARTRRRKVVLGRSYRGKFAMNPGNDRPIYIPLRRKRVRRALGKRRRMTVTFSQNMDRLKNGKKVGEANRRKRFKMRRR